MKKINSLVCVTAAFFASSAALAGNVSVFGPWLGGDQENVEAVLDGYTNATGNTYSYVGSDSFEQQVRIDAEAGSAANLSVFPQPGLAADFAKLGFLYTDYIN